jgi:hypothetical protein
MSEPADTSDDARFKLGLSTLEGPAVLALSSPAAVIGVYGDDRLEELADTGVDVEAAEKANRAIDERNAIAPSKDLEDRSPSDDGELLGMGFGGPSKVSE